MTNISIRISEDLNLALEDEARNQERSKSFLVKKAIESYLLDLHDYRLAEESYKEYLASGKKGYSLEEMKKRLGIK